jgi:hypothetical protein
MVEPKCKLIIFHLMLIYKEMCLRLIAVGNFVSDPMNSTCMTTSPKDLNVSVGSLSRDSSVVVTSSLHDHLPLHHSPDSVVSVPSSSNVPLGSSQQHHNRSVSLGEIYSLPPAPSSFSPSRVYRVSSSSSFPASKVLEVHGAPSGSQSVVFFLFFF